MNAPFTPLGTEPPPPAGKRRVVLELDEKLVARAERQDPSLSFTIERLIRRHVPLNATEAAEAQREADALCAASNAFMEKHGFWGEEFSTL